MTEHDFVANLGMLLRDQPPLTSAELTDWAVAYWDGDQVQFVFLDEDGNGQLDDGFDLDDFHWESWGGEFVPWLDNPRFAKRGELLAWLGDAPPVDLGI